MARRAALDWARHAGHVLRPSATPATNVALERDAGQRARRLADAAAADACASARRLTPDDARARIAGPGGRMRWRAVPALPPPGAARRDRPPARRRHLRPRPCARPGDDAVPAPALPRPRVRRRGRGGRRAGRHRVRPGERVVVPFQISCGACAACRIGRTGNCLAVPPISMYGFGLARRALGRRRARPSSAVPFADGDARRAARGRSSPSPRRASPTTSPTPTATSRRTCPRCCERDADAAFVIVGALRPTLALRASVALYAGLSPARSAPATCALVDARPEVRAQAERPRPRGARRRAAGAAARAAPLVVDASAHRRGLRPAIAPTAPDGICSSVGGLLHAAPAAVRRRCTGATSRCTSAAPTRAP